MVKTLILLFKLLKYTQTIVKSRIDISENFERRKKKDENDDAVLNAALKFYYFKIRYQKKLSTAMFRQVL